MKKHIAVAVGITTAMVTAQLAVAPSANALCTQQQWQVNPQQCQQIFQDESNYNAQAAKLVCNLVSQDPTPHGIWAALSYLMSEQSMSNPMPRYQILDAMGTAIFSYCPDYMPAYREYRSVSP